MVLLSVAYSIGLWGVGLPLMLLWGEPDPIAAPGWLAVGVLMAVAGVWLVWAGAAQLVSAGITPFGVRPGDRLVIDGVYGSVRNPQDIGSTLLAIGAWTMTSVADMWIVPLAAITYFAIALEPLEDRHLLERFGDDFRNYRSEVRRWLPRG